MHQFHMTFFQANKVTTQFNLLDEIPVDRYSNNLKLAHVAVTLLVTSNDLTGVKML